MGEVGLGPRHIGVVHGYTVKSMESMPHLLPCTPWVCKEEGVPTTLKKDFLVFECGLLTIYLSIIDAPQCTVSLIHSID